MVQCYPCFKFYFPLFLDIVICDNELKERKIIFKLRIKLYHNIYMYTKCNKNDYKECQ